MKIEVGKEYETLDAEIIDSRAKIERLEKELAAVQGQGYKAAYAAVLIQREQLALELNSLKPNLQPIETAKKDGSWILLFGPSGYITTPLRAHVCQWVKFDPYRRKDALEGFWRTTSGDWFTSDGGDPTHWMPLDDLLKDIG